jgi:hypothetical protein
MRYGDEILLMLFSKAARRWKRVAAKCKKLRDHNPEGENPR